MFFDQCIIVLCDANYSQIGSVIQYTCILKVLKASITTTYGANKLISLSTRVLTHAHCSNILSLAHTIATLHDDFWHCMMQCMVLCL